MSLGTGRPIVLNDETSIKHYSVLLNHPMASPTDVRLISQVELILQKSRSTHVYKESESCSSYLQLRSTRRCLVRTARSIITLSHLSVVRTLRLINGIKTATTSIVRLPSLWTEKVLFIIMLSNRSGDG